MSARFVTNFLSLLIGAAILIAVYAFARDVSDWVAVGGGAAAILLAAYSFASVDQGIYQRIADLFIALVGTWAIVAARVMSYEGRWLIFGAGLGLAVLGAIGLLVRELRLGRGLQVGASRIGPDQFATLSALQRDARARS